MKAASDALITLLATSRQVVMLDQYTFTLGDGSTLRYRGGTRPPVQEEGLLCHFDLMNGARVASAIGPDMQLISSAALTATGAKWGGSCGASGTFQANGVIGVLDRSWIAELWVTPLAGQCEYFTLYGSTYSLQIGRNTLTGSAVLYNIHCNSISGGGSNGQLAKATVVGQQNHFAVQWNAATGAITMLTNGVAHTGTPLAPADTAMWGTDTFESINVGDANCRVDDFFFHFVAEDELYGATYDVPTSSFVPPDLTQ